MPQRKVWTEEEDKILRLLRQERGERKWANIARIMELEFSLPGRTGKQCRERYHNHLDSSIVNSEWKPEEEQVLFEMHQQIGNKWSLIAQKLPGRSDNCVKNHFYSKLRKSLRKLNKLIHDCFSKEYALLKESVLSKIIKTTQSKFKNSSKVDQQLAEFCNDIKNRLFNFTFEDGEDQQEEDLQAARQLLRDIHAFDKDYKKGYKGLKFQHQFQLLKPPPKSLNKKSSTRSWDSERSQSSSSFFSSFGSESDISDLEGLQENQKNSKTTKEESGIPSTIGISSNRTSSKNTVKSQDINGYQKDQVKRQNSWHVRQIDMDVQNLPMTPPSEGSMKVQSFAHRYQDLIERDIDYCDQSNNQVNMHFHNIYYENTPVMARILGPTQLQSLDIFKENQNDEQIEYKMDKMEL